MSQKLSNATRSKHLQLRTDAVGDYLLKPNGQKHYFLTTAVTAGTTATDAAAGSLGETSHATGLGKVFRSDGSKWQPLVGYKSYTALLSQSSTDAPTATVLQNDLGGTVVLGRDEAGLYTLTLAGAFPEDKTVGFRSAVFNGGDALLIVRGERASDNVFNILCHNSGGTLTEFDITDFPIEVRVYP